MLELACAWADRHDMTGRGLEYAPLVERACLFGGAGTPAVSEFCVTEFATLQGTGPLAARAVIADALDLRWRLPMLWAQVRAGQVRAWQARKVAEQTRPLSWAACADVDAAIRGFLGMMTWTRFQKILTAAIGEADPALAAEREDRARQARGVWAMDSEDGLKTLIAKAAAGDVVWFMATINRIADILTARATLIRSVCADPKPSASSPNPPSRCTCSSPTATTPAGTATTNRRDDDRQGLSAGSERDRADAETDVDGCGLSPSAPHGDDKQCPTRDSGDDASAGRASLIMDPPPGGLDPKKLRPRVVLHFHLSDAALRAGHGLVRPEHGTASPSPSSRTGSPTPGARSPSNPYGIPPRRPPSTPTKSRTGSATPSGSATSPTSSRTDPAPPRPWTSTTPSPICR